MKQCIKCQAELADEAKICRECGEIQPSDETAGGGMFAMPYLSADMPVHSAARKKTSEKTENQKKTEAESLPETKEEKKARNIAIDQITDPRERAFAKQNRRNKLIRMTALIAAIIAALALAIYLITRNTGYHRVLDKYIDGRLQSGGTVYASIVPEIYLLEAEDIYSMSRPDVRSNTENYLEYVEEQMENDFGSGIDFTYKIVSESTTDNEAALTSLEESILSVYGTDLVITEAAYVSLRLTTKGSITQETETLDMTFFKYDGKWYSMDAMKIIQFACENSGYGLW
ncbi:MAG: zinc ribbon domain-containing protein [Oscillospiraceae bacterium]|nr:zinc ribbon domain-containing protein [Oscillospiraceae bacterium]